MCCASRHLQPLWLGTHLGLGLCRGRRRAHACVAMSGPCTRSLTAMPSPAGRPDVLDVGSNHHRRPRCSVALQPLRHPVVCTPTSSSCRRQISMSLCSLGLLAVPRLCTSRRLTVIILRAPRHPFSAPMLAAMLRSDAPIPLRSLFWLPPAAPHAATRSLFWRPPAALAASSGCRLQRHCTPTPAVPTTHASSMYTMSVFPCRLRAA